MKSLIKNILAVAAMTVAPALNGFAQTRSVEHDLSPFEGIEASGGFKVKIVQSDSYTAKITVDDALESYVQCYVKAGVLHVGLDDKSVPKDLKKQYKGKNAAEPTLIATVSMPILNSMTLNDDSEFYNTGNLTAENFTLILNGSTGITNLKIVAKTANLTVNKNAKLSNLNVTTEGDITLNGDGKGTVTMECTAENLYVNSAGNCDLTVNGPVEKKVVVTTSGSGKTSVSGTAGSLEVNGSKGGSSKVEATALKVDTATVSLTGGTAEVAPAKNLELDLGKGAEVDYAGDPVIKIVKIQSATVLRK